MGEEFFLQITRCLPDVPLDAGPEQWLDILREGGVGELSSEILLELGPGNAQLPVPNMLMMDRITRIADSGGAYGKGRVYEQGKHVGNTSMTQVTVGFQLGGQAYSQIIFFEDKRAFDEFTSGNFEFGAQATAVAITAGASAAATTTGSAAGASGGRHDATTAGAGYHKGMATFTVATGGLMYEASVGGQKFSYTPL